MKVYSLILLLNLLCFTRVQTGLEVLLQNPPKWILNKKVGLISNPTGVNHKLETNIDLLSKHPQIQLSALYGPEHGIRGDIPAGKHFKTYKDPQTSLPVYSLYGEELTAEKVKGIDTILYDIQDIGSRSYTFIWTLAKVMQKAVKYNKEIVVLDRPDIFGGNIIDGAIVQEDLRSFIGLFPIPRVYGMTVGELAYFLNNEFNINCRLRVIPMRGYHRGMTWEQTRLPWVLTSPHIPNIQSALSFSATGALGTISQVNIGVGYTLPFQTIAAPWIDNEHMLQFLKSIKIPGIRFKKIHYTPYYGKFKNKQIQGIQLFIYSSTEFFPASTEIAITWYLFHYYPKFFKIPKDKYLSIDKVWGKSYIRETLLNGATYNKIINLWQHELQDFNNKRNKYLIYK